MRISDWSSDVCSSDLVRNGSGFLRRFPPGNGCYAASIPPQRQELRGRADRQSYWRFRTSLGRCGRADGEAARSEEHTSELQSLMRTSYAVFCLKTKTPHILKE